MTEQQRQCTVRYTITFIALILSLTACGRRDTEIRRDITGTWFQGSNNAHTLTFASDGTYISIFGGYQDHHIITYEGKWTIKRGGLVLSGVRSNSTPLADPPFQTIFRVDDHYLWFGESRAYSFDLHR
jgi:hypothetical protein